MYTKNAILLRPMQNCTDKSMLEAFESVYEELKAAECAPKLHVLDNECSQAIKKLSRASIPTSNSLSPTTINSTR